MVHDSTMAIVHHFTGWWGSRKTPNCFRMPVDSAHCLTKSLWNLRDGVSRLVLPSAGIRKMGGGFVGFVRLFKSFRKSYLLSSWQELMSCCADDSDCSGSGQAIWIHLYIYINIHLFYELSRRATFSRWLSAQCSCSAWRSEGLPDTGTYPGVCLRMFVFCFLCIYGLLLFYFVFLCVCMSVCRMS